MTRDPRRLAFVALMIAGCASRGPSTSAPAAGEEPAAAVEPAPVAAPHVTEDVERLVALMQGSFSSREQALADPEYFDIRLKLDALRHEDLVRKDGCEVVLREVEPGRFAGATGRETCASDLRGASWATSEVEITADGVHSWDRGFDGAGAQVWGATQGGYVFRHDDPEAPPVAPPAKQ